MGDSNVESSNLARKVMKIDGNPRVNLLRGSSKGNDASKTNSSSRYPVRGTAVDSKMMINPKSNAGNSYADMARKSGLDSATLGRKINFRYMLIDQESELLASLRVASLDEERFLKQKSKGKEVPKAFVDHYVGFLGREEAVIIPITQELFDVRIDQAMSVDMIREVKPAAAAR
ncbi:hypothetical protein QVD17_06843 [Tagetes erecta]|uniref:Uncharacterized protein n=1 Tax=Tagetes erecta TaxID=13708 RepID=A0AAD8LGB2_TARER|nr:hypothetical protein QVD17_06843 [Tagetes erecta]